VHTTLELVIADLEGLAFDRSADAETGYRELDIRPTLRETGPIRP
jgi:predicted DNA-binding protein with PD1-like motif